MQDPTPLIRELTEELEHAHDILSELDFSGCDDDKPGPDEAIDRARVIQRANAWLTSTHNADLFAEDPAP